MTARQQKALAALLSTSSKAAAARAAGISDRTLRDYLADPTFRAEYEKAFKDMVEDATKQAKQSLSPALSTLRMNLGNRLSSDSTQKLREPLAR